MVETEEEMIQRLIKEGLANTETDDEKIQRLIKEGIAKAKNIEYKDDKDKPKPKPTNSVRNSIIFICMIIVFGIIIAIFVSPDFKDATPQSTPQSKESDIVQDKDGNVISWGSQSKTITDSYGNIIYTRDTCFIYLTDSTMAIHGEYNDCTQDDIKQWSNAQGYSPVIITTPTPKSTPVTSKPISIQSGDGGAGITDISQLP